MSINSLGDKLGDGIEFDSFLWGFLMRWMKWLAIVTVSFTLFCVGLFSFLHFYRPREIKPSTNLQKKITAVYEEDPCWNVTVAPEKIREINDIFSQHFYFLGQGRQCTAYVSYDGQYVLKFLLQKPLVVKPRFLELPDIFPVTLFKKYKVHMRQKRKQDLFYAFMISYHIAPEQTGMMYVHLNSTDNIFHKPLIVDTNENPVYIDPDVTQFIIQRRARHIKPVIIDLMREGRVAQAKERVSQVLLLLYEAAQKGIVDADPGLIRNNNIGFLENRAIYVDTGKLRLKKDRLLKKDFVKDLKRLEPFNRWLQAYYPELAEHYAEKRQTLIASYDESARWVFTLLKGRKGP